MNTLLLPADIYIVINKSIITEEDKKIINMLYDEWVNVRIYAVTSLGKLNDTN